MAIARGLIRALFAGALLAVVCCATTARRAAPLPEGRVWLNLHKLDGTPVTTGSLRGKVVALTVISTWANPALLEIPRLKRLSASYGSDDLAVVCVVLEPSREMVQIFADTFEIPYLVVQPDDLGQFTGDQGPLGPIRIIPTSAVIDRDGRVVARMEGMWPKRVLEEAVQRLVAASPGGP